MILLPNDALYVHADGAAKSERVVSLLEKNVEFNETYHLESELKLTLNRILPFVAGVVGFKLRRRGLCKLWKLLQL